MTHLPTFLIEPNPDVYLSDNYVVFDFETTNRDFGNPWQGDNRIVLTTYKLGRGHPDRQGRDTVRASRRVGDRLQWLASLIAKAAFIVVQNAKFELAWLQFHGIDTSKILVYDTMLGEYVRLGNRQGKKDLDTLAGRYEVGGKNNLVKTLIEGGVCPSDIPERWLLEYGKQDTATTEEVFLKQRRELQELGLLPHLYLMCLVTPVLVDIESKGMGIDRLKVRQEYLNLVEREKEVKETLDRVAPGINFNSGPQVAKFLYETIGFAEVKDYRGETVKTKAGKPKTDSDTINQLIATTPEQEAVLKAILEYKDVEARLRLVSKLYEACKEQPDVGVPLLYFNINQAVTQTGRFSSSGRKHKIQGQNLTREYKVLFVPRTEGWYFCEVDGMQLEFRVAAHLGRDEVATGDIRSKWDVHKYTASVINKVPLSRVTKSLRQNAKAYTFRPLYGGSAGDKVVRDYCEAFRERYSGIYNTQRGWTFEVLGKKKLTTEWGFHFYWPNTVMHESGYIENTTNIFNYPGQRFAPGEIIPIALVYTWHRLRAAGAKTFLVNTIHDSIEAEVHPDERELFREVVQEAFTKDTYTMLFRLYGVRFTVPLGAEGLFADRWGADNGEKFEYELDPENNEGGVGV